MQTNIRPVAERVSRSLLHTDRLVFAMLLAQIRLRASSNDVDSDELDYFLVHGTPSNLLYAGDDLHLACKFEFDMNDFNDRESGDVTASPLSVTGQRALGALATTLPIFRHVAAGEGGYRVRGVHAH